MARNAAATRDARSRPPTRKPAIADRELLQQEREDGAGKAEAEGEEKGKPERRVVAQVGSELEANREAERGDEKPEKPAPEKEKRDAEQQR